MSLKELRERAQLRQVDVAERLEVDQAAVSNWERGVNKPASLSICSTLAASAVDWESGASKRAALTEHTTSYKRGRLGKSRRGDVSNATVSSVESCHGRLVRARLRKERFGMAWKGRRGIVWRRKASHGKPRQARNGMPRRKWFGLPWKGAACLGRHG